MYGLLLESLACFIKEKYGEEKWEEIRRAANVEQTSFSTHSVYPENLIPKLSTKAMEVLQVSERELMCHMGESFVDFVGQYGYDRVLSVLGRHMRDFLNGLDNLHEYLKFSYPRMRAPSFFCENESSTGLTLHYRSKRRGFVFYTMGQIKQVGKVIYDREVEITVVKEENIFDMHVVTFDLKFDNRAFSSLATIDRDDERLPLRASVFIEIFPFCILFGSDMIIKKIGNSLSHILPELIGQDISQVFDLARPLIEFKYSSILKRTNNIFELISHNAICNGEGQSFEDNDDHSDKKIQLKGQMLYMEEWKMIVFLGTPQMKDLDAMIKLGLFINDLSMHDFSRDLMMAGTQQSVELKLALDQEQQKSKKLEESMKKLDEEMKRTDELLYQMIPKLVADRLRKGENPVDTCQVFECVTVLFSDVVTFTEICSRISPMEVVSMLNAMYSIFDQLTELNGVYKVETIGDAYMAVGGAPVKDPLHAAKICDMALDMVDAIQGLSDPSTGRHLRIRVGVHSGAVVAGVVGLKMPRYCLFGDSVNTASRMESTSEPMKVHISETTRELLGPNYSIAERGEIAVKGKGQMKTYWLTDREGRNSITAGTIKLVDDTTGAGGGGFGSASPATSSHSRGYSPVTFAGVAGSTPRTSPAHVVGTSVPQQKRRSIAELEKGLQKSQSSLMDQKVTSRTRDNVATVSTNHLAVSTAPTRTAPSSSSAKSDFKLTCPHRKATPKKTLPLLCRKKEDGKSPLSPPLSNTVNWSFPPAHSNKVRALPDVAVGHATRELDKEFPLPAVGQLMMPDNHSDDSSTSREKGMEPVAMGAAATGAIPDGDFCCPAMFDVIRPMRSARLSISNRAGDQSSVTCNLV